MKFSGKIVEGSSGGVYSYVSVDGLRFPLCYGTLYERVGLPRLTVDSLYGNKRYEFAWGYDGLSPQFLAATMLAVAMGIGFCPKQFEFDGESVPVASIAHLGGDTRSKFGSIYLANKPPPYCKNIPLKVKQLYKQFTSEVVANFGDTWEITSEEILQWIKEKESQRKSSVVK